jgi:hypothetical protein
MAACALLILTAAPVYGQGFSPVFNQRDDQYRLLGLKRAKDAFEVARAEYERQQELFDRDLITRAQLERGRSSFSDAEVNYQQSLLAVLFEEQFLSVTDAVKYRADDGAKHVRITLANTSGGSAEFQKLLNIEEELFRSLQPDLIHNIYVSIMNDDGAVVSRPYEAKIDQLRYGEPATIDFVLLQDLDAVTINIIYSNGSERRLKIFLAKDASVNQVVVQSEQFSQEVDLGQSASFDLTLELFSGSREPYRLAVVNLPSQIGRFFKDPSGSVRLSQVKFTESTQSKRAALEISLPDRPTDDVTMDEPITFYVLVIPQNKTKLFAERRDAMWSEAAIAELDVGSVRLELIPRGRGELLVRAPILYHSIIPGEQVTMTIDLINEGTRRLDNIAFDVDLPLHWTRKLVPDVIATLNVAEEARIIATFTPPDDVSEGKYDIRLRSSAMSNNQPVNGEDKTVSVAVRAEASIFGIGLLVLLLVGVVGGMVFFGIRLSRR